MQGHAALIAMRQKGRRPVAVNLHVAAQWPAKPGQFDMPSHEVFVTPDEVPQRADLRFLVGLDVLVTAPAGQAGPVPAWCQACVEAGAAQVIGYEEPESALAQPLAERLIFDFRKGAIHG